MSRRTVKVWVLALLINLVSNLVMHFCGTCNTTLNYISSIIAAFALGIFIQEYCYGKNE